ncbi:MAG: hypothetical protein ACI4V7_11455 [Succinivibrionaceae bacterium]
MCKELTLGYLSNLIGEYSTPEGYFVNQSKVMDFDKNFPPKNKLKHPGQIFE